ncbi:MAG: class I adenylate-forming enzyme family protein [Reyranellaceae bacterium]
MNQFAGTTYARAIEWMAQTYADNEALVYRDRRYSFRDAKQLIDRASGRLATLGLPPGSTISIWLPNRPEYLWYLLGAAQMGLVPVILNTRLRLEEFAYQLGQSDSRAVIVPGDAAFRNFLGDLAELCPELKSPSGDTLSIAALPQMRHVVALDPFDRQALPGVTDWSDGLERDWPVPPYATDPDAPALISYSSGTTALPKGAMITHCVWRKAWDIGTPVDMSANDRFYLAIPMFGSMASMNGVYPVWIRGGGVVLADRFDAEQAMKDWQEERCSVTHLLPPMITALLEHPKRKEYDLSSMRIAMVLSNDQDVLLKVARDLAIPGMMTGYGLTESTTVLTRNRWDDPLEDRIDNQGRPLPDVEIRIVDPQTGKDMPTGESGEIWARSYCIMKGYYNKPVETAKAIDGEGWFHTGDQGYLRQDGRLVFEGRIGDGYKTKGFNVSPAEVETLLRKHPAVANAALVGLPHPELGDMGVAFVVPRVGQRPLESELIAFARDNLASFKVPQHVIFVDAFPLTSGTDKVQKYKLREMASETLGVALKRAGAR